MIMKLISVRKITYEFIYFMLPYAVKNNCVYNTVDRQIRKHKLFAIQFPSKKTANNSVK